MKVLLLASGLMALAGAARADDLFEVHHCEFGRVVVDSGDLAQAREFAALRQFDGLDAGPPGTVLFEAPDGSAQWVDPDDLAGLCAGTDDCRTVWTSAGTLGAGPLVRFPARGAASFCVPVPYTLTAVYDCAPDGTRSYLPAPFRTLDELRETYALPPAPSEPSQILVVDGQGHWVPDVPYPERDECRALRGLEQPRAPGVYLNDGEWSLEPGEVRTANCDADLLAAIGPLSDLISLPGDKAWQTPVLVADLFPRADAAQFGGQLSEFRTEILHSRFGQDSQQVQITFVTTPDPPNSLAIEAAASVGDHSGPSESICRIRQFYTARSAG